MIECLSVDQMLMFMSSIDNAFMVFERGFMFVLPDKDPDGNTLAAVWEWNKAKELFCLGEPVQLEIVE